MKRSVALLACAVFLAAVERSKADYIDFNDSQPTAITVTANGFLGSPLTLDGTFVLTNGTFTYESTTEPKGVNITFAGTDNNIGSPSTYSATYDLIASPTSTIPLEELILNATETGPAAEHITGTFIGSGDPNLPGSVPGGATTIVGMPGYIQVGGSPNAILQVDAVPEPTSACVMILVGGAILIRNRRSPAQ